MTGDDKDGRWFQRVLDSIDDLVLVKGDRSKLQWANRAFRDLYGMTQAQLQDIVDSPASDPDDTVQYVRDDHHVYTTGERLDIPAEAITDSAGAVHYYNTVKSAIRDEGGAIVGTVGVSRLVGDAQVEALSRAERASRKGTLGELRTLVANIPLGVAMFDRQKRLIAASRLWSSLFDRCTVEPGDYYDETFEKQLPLADEIESVIRGGAPIDRDDLEMSRRERRSTVMVMIRPWELGVDDVGGVVVHVEDRTQHLSTASRLSRVNAELAAFNYRISHDLVAPLATSEGLISAAQRQLERGDVKTAAECIRRVANENRRLQSLLTNVLELSRADLGDVELADRVSLHDLFERVFEVSQGFADESSVTLSYRSEVDGVLTADQRLFQILVGLVQNGIKYHGPGPERWVRVDATVVEERFSQRLEIRVEDNGVGVHDDVAPTVFDLFVRGSAGHQGHGLGLYIARTHAERLGGKLTLESTAQPTVFLLSMPLETPDNERAEGPP